MTTTFRRLIVLHICASKLYASIFIGSVYYISNIHVYRRELRGGGQGEGDIPHSSDFIDKSLRYCKFN